VSTAGQAHADTSERAHAVDRAQAVTRYGRLMGLIATDRCVLLDGATGTELIGVSGQRPEVEEHLWGLTALLDSPDDVLAVHRQYVETGCDVISTNTWGLPTALRRGGVELMDLSEPVHWMDVALPLGLTGVWLFLFARNLRSRALLPLNDPFFKEAFAHDVH
jgi:hypothetical protein